MNVIVSSTLEFNNEEFLISSLDALAASHPGSPLRILASYTALQQRKPVIKFLARYANKRDCALNFYTASHAESEEEFFVNDQMVKEASVCLIFQEGKKNGKVAGLEKVCKNYSKPVKILRA